MNPLRRRPLTALSLATLLSACVNVRHYERPSITVLDVNLPQALQGDPKARTQVGLAFTRGWSNGGLSIDSGAGLRQLIEAAEHNQVDAQLELGDLYRIDTPLILSPTPYLVRKDPEKSLYWYNRAAEQEGASKANVVGLINYYLTPINQGYSLLQACKWSLIRSLDDKCAIERLSDQEFAEAKRLAQEWLNRHPGTPTEKQP